MNEQVWNLKIRHEIQRKRKYWNMNCSTNQAQRIYHVAFAPFQFLAPIAILSYSFARILKVTQPNLRDRYQMRSALHLILWKYSQMMLLTLVVKDPKRNLLSWKIIRILNMVLRNHLLFSLTNVQKNTFCTEIVTQKVDLRIQVVKKNPQINLGIFNIYVSR